MREAASSQGRSVDRSAHGAPSRMVAPVDTVRLTPTVPGTPSGSGVASVPSRSGVLSMSSRPGAGSMQSRHGAPSGLAMASAPSARAMADARCGPSGQSTVDNAVALPGWMDFREPPGPPFGDGCCSSGVSGRTFCAQPGVETPRRQPAAARPPSTVASRQRMREALEDELNCPITQVFGRGRNLFYSPST